MKVISCKNCGGTMTLDASGMTAVCPYCGSKFLLDHQDTDYYKTLLSRMNAFFASSKNDQERRQQAEQLWETAETKTFFQRGGTPVAVKYMYRYSDPDADVYVARHNIVFHFRHGGAEKAEHFRRNTAMLDYPSADIRKLEDFFPKFSGGFLLEDGSYLCVIQKSEDEYPLRLFGTLPGRHAAWVISRMENLCCVLEFSSLVHPRITPDTLYINPYTHQASLYGGWWNAGRHNTRSPGDGHLLQLRENLTGLRNTAASSLGFADSSQVRAAEGIPQALADFIRSAPRATAYDDFALWDDMLIRAYGQRKFVTMNVDDGDIYTKKG